ncbi:DUF5996 family protein [Streptomyces sp. NPDC056749]|uniref:DUF5996 family protein n=1 Tax=Streptomyces sp. NPDC056749 TaxID=3345936 RepID=UPI0036BBEAC6
MTPSEFGSPMAWPRLLVAEWTRTRETLHMWLQIAGKLRLACAPMTNHWWQVTFYVTPRGLTTSAIPYGAGVFDIEFDFIEHELVLRTSNGGKHNIALRSMPVAEFYSRLMSGLSDLGISVKIQNHPNETEVAISFPEDFEHCTYDAGAVNLFWRQLIPAHRSLLEFRSHFSGKVSPVHFFWGSLDLACTRFSGRGAPAHPGGAPHCGDWVMVEGYSHELSSCGFWPGGGEEGAFYSYAYPEPKGYADTIVAPKGAAYSRENGQFLLPYEEVRKSREPDRTLASFLHSTYEAAADCGRWDRASLETDPRRWESGQHY